MIRLFLKVVTIIIRYYLNLNLQDYGLVFKSGVSEAKVQIVQLGVMGNYWEETDASEHYMTSSTEQSQVAEINGSETEVSASVNIKDTAFIDVSTINNRENADVYFKSPNSATERDVSTNAVLKETALVLKYKTFPGQEVGVTRVFDNGVKDFTSYKSIKWKFIMKRKRLQFLFVSLCNLVKVL